MMLLDLFVLHCEAGQKQTVLFVPNRGQSATQSGLFVLSFANATFVSDRRRPKPANDKPAAICPIHFKDSRLPLDDLIF